MLIGGPNGLLIWVIPTPIPDQTTTDAARAGNSHSVLGGKFNLSSNIPPPISMAPPKMIARKNFNGTI